MSSTVAADSPETSVGTPRDGRTLLVAHTGGHLSELVQLRGRLAGVEDHPLWLVPDRPQSHELLSGEDVVFAPPVEPRDLLGLPPASAAVDRVLRRHEVDCVVSTGAGIAVAAFVPARLRGIACHYIESAARVAGPSLSGRLVSTLPGVHLYMQHGWPSPGRWHRASSVFDGFEARIRESERAPGPLRVVVTVGTLAFDFRRLFDPLVHLLPADADVLWQTGPTGLPGVDAQPWVAVPELERRMRAADVVIAHAGVGSALSALKSGAFPVLVPRRRSHGEHVDDHQIQIAHALAERGLALVVDPEEITEGVLAEAAAHVVVPCPSRAAPIALSRHRRR